MAKKRPMPPKRRKPDVNPDSVLEIVRLCGGYSQAAKKMAKNGVFNPSTNKPYSKHSVKRLASLSAGFPEYLKSIESRRETFGDKVDALLDKVRHEETPA